MIKVVDGVETDLYPDFASGCRAGDHAHIPGASEHGSAGWPAPSSGGKAGRRDWVRQGPSSDEGDAICGGRDGPHDVAIAAPRGGACDAPPHRGAEAVAPEAVVPRIAVVS